MFFNPAIPEATGNGRRACGMRNTGIGASLRARNPLGGFWTGFDETRGWLCCSRSDEYAFRPTDSRV